MGLSNIKHNKNENAKGEGFLSKSNNHKKKKKIKRF